MKIEEYINQLLDHLRVKPDHVSVEEGDDYVFIVLEVTEDDAGKMIGNKGETISALTHLLNLSFYERLDIEDGDRKKVVVDVNDYKGRREEKATEIGYEAADRARETQRPQDLPPMAAYERRVIHQALSEEEGVFTRSEGQGRDRRLVVYPAGYEIDSEN